VVVVRVEDGILSELASVFSDVFAGFLSPVGSLPLGSVVLLGSLSHLSKWGISNYTEDLVRNIGSLSMRTGAGVQVVSLVLVPLGEIGDPGAVREAYDLNYWIMSSPLGPRVGLGAARASLWDSIHESGGGGRGSPLREVSLSPHKLPESA
jgi:hypothetical protein